MGIDQVVKSIYEYASPDMCLRMHACMSKIPNEFSCKKATPTKL